MSEESDAKRAADEPAGEASSDGLGEQGSGLLKCARCKRHFPEEESAPFPQMLARLFRVFFGSPTWGEEEELSASYCPACRKYLVRLTAVVVSIFGSVILAFVIAKLVEWLQE
jgi:uncharacterized protein YbaR (Trm112 family)